MTQLQRLHAFIQAHGFESWTVDGIIEIAIPATVEREDGSRETVEFIERCKPTLASVKWALGY
jgi:hypothetical protein